MNTFILSICLFLRRYFRWGTGILLSGMTVSVGAQGLAAMEIIPLPVSPAPSCHIQAPDGGRYLYARLTAGLFRVKDTASLPPMTQRWSVMCDAPASPVLQVRDLQAPAGGEQDSTAFGLGAVNGQGALGIYRITLSHADTNGRTTGLYETSDPSVTGRVAAQQVVSAGKYYGWSETGTGPDKGTVFSVDITVSPQLNSLQRTGGPLVSGAELDGQAEITFSFGL